MSVKTFIEKIEADLGIEPKNIVNLLPTVETVAENLDAVLKNSVVDGLLDALTKGVAAPLIPQVTNALDKAISDLAIGSAIEADVNAANGTEAKLQVFIADLQKYGVVRKSIFLTGILTLVLAGLDNNALKQEIYALYVQAQLLLKGSN